MQEAFDFWNGSNKGKCPWNIAAEIMFVFYFSVSISKNKQVFFLFFIFTISPIKKVLFLS